MLYLVDPTQVEIDKRRTCFIAFAVPLQEQAHVLSQIKRIKECHPKAQHFCYAWRMFDGEGTSDDGELHGSAGVPILKPIEGHNIVNILVVVVRYFGGAAGVGGLVRAYGLACKRFYHTHSSNCIFQRADFDSYSMIRKVLFSVLSNFPTWL